MAARLEFPAQLEVVEDLTVERDPLGSIGGRHWLPPALDVDDAQSRVREADRTVADPAPGVGPAMPDDADHPVEQHPVGWFTRPIDVPRDAAHGRNFGA